MKEYRTIREVNGPLMVVDQVEGNRIEKVHLYLLKQPEEVKPEEEDKEG